MSTLKVVKSRLVSKYLLSNSITVTLSNRLGQEEGDPDDNVVIDNPGGGPHYVVGGDALEVVVSLNGDVKLFVLEKSGCGSAFRCLGSLFCIRSKAAYDISRLKSIFPVESAA